MPSALGRGLDEAIRGIESSLAELEQTSPYANMIQEFADNHKITEKSPEHTRAELEYKQSHGRDYATFNRLQMELHIEETKDRMRLQVPKLRAHGLNAITAELEQFIQSDTSDWEYEQAGKFNWNRARPDLCMIQERLEGSDND